MSTLAALNVLAECAGRRIAILGDMLELGAFAEEGHRMVGRRVAEIADRLFCVGRLAHWFAEEALACGMARDHITLFAQSEQVLPEVLALVAAGDYILVKGSRGIAMEQIVTALTCEQPQNVAKRTEKTAYSLREDL
jgi:UDP-N-acetylmuramoyl-tripeptide--D-alanyl-D-alanine ligase